MTEIDLEDVPNDVSAIVNNVDHLCDVAKSGGIQKIAEHCFEISQAADKLNELAIKLIDIQQNYRNAS